MSRHTKASRRAALRAYCILRVIDCDTADDGWLSDGCMCRFRGGCGGLGVIECRGCETECFGCEDCDMGEDDSEMWTEDYDDHAEGP